MRGSSSASHGQQHLKSWWLDLAENIGLALTLPGLHWACISEPILTESWRCTCQGHLRSSTNSDLTAALLLGLNLLLGLRTRRYLQRLWIRASLSCRMTNRGPITTTCTSIGPHPPLLTLRMTDLSIPLGGRNVTSKKIQMKQGDKSGFENTRF